MEEPDRHLIVVRHNSMVDDGRPITGGEAQRHLHPADPADADAGGVWLQDADQVLIVVKPNVLRPSTGPRCRFRVGSSGSRRRLTGWQALGGGFPNVFQLLPEGVESGYSVGKDVHVPRGTPPEDYRSLFAWIATVFITFEEESGLYLVALARQSSTSRNINVFKNARNPRAQHSGVRIRNRHGQIVHFGNSNVRNEFEKLKMRHRQKT